jgi:hypothetical protein
MLAARIYFIGFFIARALHSVFYIRAHQPHRTVAFGAAFTLLLGMTVSTLWTLLAAA